MESVYSKAGSVQLEKVRACSLGLVSQSSGGQDGGWTLVLSLGPSDGRTLGSSVPSSWCHWGRRLAEHTFCSPLASDNLTVLSDAAGGFAPRFTETKRPSISISSDYTASIDFTVQHIWNPHIESLSPPSIALVSLHATPQNCQGRASLELVSSGP